MRVVDPNAPARAVINCRCVLIPRVMLPWTTAENGLTDEEKSGIIPLNRFGDEFRTARIPMPQERYDCIVAGFERQGGIIRSDAEAQRLLDFNEKQNGGKTVFASALNASTIIARPNPTAAELFEELIHTTQYKRELTDGSGSSRIRCEIIAHKKLIAHAKAYGISDHDLELTKHNLTIYKELWKRITGGGLDRQ